MMGEYAPLLTTLAGTGLLGLTASVLGVFAVLRKQSLLGDAISHAAFPGIAATLYITGSSNPSVLTCGGCIAGMIGAVCAQQIAQYSRIKYDALLAIVLSVFFGFGLMIVTMIQKYAFAEQSVLGKFLFGNAATLLMHDIGILAGVSVCICLAVYVLWKEMTLLAFDRQFAHSIGYTTYLLDALMTALLVVTVSVGLHLVGVLLMSSLLIAPAAAARQWTRRITSMTAVSGGIGVMSSVTGTLLSSLEPNVPTGPVIVIVLSVCVVVSLIAAPHRGIMWEWLQRRRIRQ